MKRFTARNPPITLSGIGTFQASSCLIPNLLSCWYRVLILFHLFHIICLNRWQPFCNILNKPFHQANSIVIYPTNCCLVNSLDYFLKFTWAIQKQQILHLMKQFVLHTLLYNYSLYIIQSSYFKHLPLAWNRGFPDSNGKNN